MKIIGSLAKNVIKETIQLKERMQRELLKNSHILGRSGGQSIPKAIKDAANEDVEMTDAKEEDEAHQDYVKVDGVLVK